MIHFFILVNRVGKCRLQRWFDGAPEKEQTRIIRELATAVLTRSSKLCNFLEYKGLKVVYRKYASLYFITGIDPQDNEFVILELIQQYVEMLDAYFGSVCELDLVFNFHKAYYLLQELLMAGEILDTSKKVILQAMKTQDINEASEMEGVPEI
ncbi:Adaptor protein complex 1 (AP-1), sigma subunit [Monocercomonoides exilis]|uniref:Adaptor protein complex 1 (AP-1), sigma subunit n=1 Tax=Monocercomonoides exilis TaxID=2049356 RepID=UPI003559DB61|nr:Adaptor protein complex 1 (AP-1), sigma subunit [Monocercomonoides exilis]|eukprot:MONOS_15884.1-p1 / transcript=MONOS_15884.1 / gene=MONOS_15884 / organism=Monocercomonoides_exilis_PA203 / gene_product= Adaptor protein complex 1 (AP-1), sigma subunit / transcript_product= Adaptor protein complex 1 (AP-1), sigma subunit / location=Mono_scaffold01391:3033-3556(-) / protein_length=153 / sequence_SO=supercontig / SO=protein_coding / is_pseudo=false